MSFSRRVTALYRLFFQRRRVEKELDEEVNAYFAILVARFMQEGLSEEGARRAARLQWDPPELVKQKVRDVRIGAGCDAVLQDFRFGVRMLRNNPLFTAVAVCSLAIGIGANSAIYSFADWWLLRPLPVFDPSHLVAVVPVGNTVAGSLNAISYPDYLDLRDHNRTFAGLLAQGASDFGFASGSATLPRRAVGMFVSGNFFSVLGVKPVAGRVFQQKEDTVAGRDAVAVLAYDLWNAEYHADPAVVGRRVRLNGIAVTIIGVAPSSFTGTDQFLRPAVYLPLAMAPALMNKNLLDQRQTQWLTLKGRLKPGLGMAQAQADLDAIANSLHTLYPRTDANLHMRVESQLRFQTEFSPPTTAMLLMLALLSFCVLLISCANVAGLLLSRSRVRAREMALRLALGAGRNALLRQLMIENLLLAFAGGAAGLALAYAGVRLFNTLPTPSPDMPFRMFIHLDRRALLFTVLLSVLSALLFGIMPARRSLQWDLASALKTANGSAAIQPSLWARKLLVIGQVALSLVLLIICAGLLEGFRAELTQGPGFRREHLFLMTLDPSLVHYTDAQRDRFYTRLMEDSRQAPHVQSATLASSVPLAFGASTMPVLPEGYQLHAGQESLDILGSVVSDGFFSTLRIPIVQGRGFTPSDNNTAPAVAVVNEHFAQHYWPGKTPLGKRLYLRNSQGRPIEVVGIARTTKYIFISEAPLDYVYLPFTQHPQSQMTLIAGGDGIASVLKQVVRGIDPNMPVFDARSMQDLYSDRALKTPRLITNTVSSLAALGLILAVVGLYGLMAYSVGLRRHEIGIRMALGADRREVVSMVMLQGMRLAIPGVIAGSVLGLEAYRALSASVVFNFGNPGLAPFAAIGLVLLLTIALATFVPARSAARIDPMRTLRQE